jgi:ankyrin repeat protein
MNDLVDRLDGLIDSLNEGEEATRSISSRLSTANFSSSNTNDPEWNEIKQALIASGFSPEIISEQRTYILHWLENASVSGRLVQQTDLTGDSPQCLDNDTRHTMTAETQTITQDNLRLSRVNSPVSHCQSDNHPREDSLDRKGPKRERWRYSIVHRLRYLSADPFLALRKAVIRSDYSAVSRLLQEASISDRLQLEGSVFIGFAVEKKDSDMLGLFVEQCSSVDWSQILREQLRHTLQTGSGRELLDTYIKYGASFGSVELAAAMSWAPESTFCQMLRSEHNSVDYEGWAQTFLYISAKLGYTAIFEEFVKQYGGINSLVEGTTPFHIACGSGNFDVVQKAFEMGGNLMTLDSEGESPVHAVAWGEVHDNWDIRRTLRYLIGKGASLGAKTEHGKSLLHLAAEMSNVRAIETLLGVEVQCDVFDNLGNTPLHAASCNEELKGPLGHEHRLDSMPFYHPTLRRRCTQIDFRSLVNESAIYSEGYCTKIDGLKFFNRQPKPAKRGSLDAVLTLLRYGAAANRQNNDGVSPLHLASRCADIPRMLALLVNGADPNMKDNSGWTALRYAISANSGPAVQLCLEHGADTSGSAIVSVGQESEVRLTILEHIKFIRATELLYILRKHEDPECPDETIEGLEDLQNSSEYTYDNGRLKMERIRKNIEEETRRHAEQAARPKTDVLG